MSVYRKKERKKERKEEPFESQDEHVRGMSWALNPPQSIPPVSSFSFLRMLANFTISIIITTKPYIYIFITLLPISLAPNSKIFANPSNVEKNVTGF